MGRALQVVPLVIVAVLASRAVAATPALTPDGWGGLKIGMTERAATRAFGLKRLRGEGVYSDECRELSAPGQPQLTVMVENGRVTRISIAQKGPLRTDRDLGVGSTEAEVRRAYGNRLRVDPNTYEDLPARYLTYWSRNGHGVRYETSTNARVARLQVGGRAITYVEGCL